jgi:hypothetical protein
MLHIAGQLDACLTEIRQHYDIINESVMLAMQNAAPCDLFVARRTPSGILRGHFADS